MAGEIKKSVGIFGRMLLVLVAVASVPMGLLWYVSYREESAQLTKGIDVRLGSTADKLAQYTDQWFDAHMRMLRMVAQHPDMVSMNAEKQRPLLNGIAEQYPYIYLAHTIRLDGTNEGRSDGKAPLYYGDRNYFRDALTVKAAGFEAAISKTTRMPAFMIAVPILKNGQPVGVLSAALHINDISKLIVDTAIGKTGYAFLLDAKGKVIAHPEKDFARDQSDLSGHPAYVAFKAERQQPFQIFDKDGKSLLAVAVPIREGMTLIAQQDTAEAYAPLVSANERAAKLLGASVLLVVLLAFAFSRGLTNPIRRLTRAAEAMSLGEMNVEIPEGTRGDELGGLARAIDRMGVSLRLAMSTFEATPPNKETKAEPKADSARPKSNAPRTSGIVPRASNQPREKVGS